MRKKKMICVSIAFVMLICLLPSTALADTYNAADCPDITITADTSGQKVQIGSRTFVDDNPVFSGVYNSYITVVTADGATANLTMSDLSIASFSTTGALNVGASNANVTLEGLNGATNNHIGGPAIYVSSGNLSIIGDGQLGLCAYTTAIGSNNGEEMSGTIFIGGDAEVVAFSMESAGIGSGNNGEMSGLISVGDNATVYASADEVGIGCGSDGLMSGTIAIGDNANVIAIGWQGQPGIGAGNNGEVTGLISITDNATVQSYSLFPSTTIGCNENNFSGTIKILDAAQVMIGTAWSGVIDSQFVFESTSNNGHIGADIVTNHTQSGGKFFTGVDTVINGVKGDDVEGLKSLINMHLDEYGNPINHFVVYPPVAPPEVEPEVEPVNNPLYRVVDAENHDIRYTAETANGVLTIIADFDQAILTGTLANLNVLANSGVQTIVFKTIGAQSTFSLSTLIAAGNTTDGYEVCHDGSVAELTIASQTVSGILN